MRLLSVLLVAFALRLAVVIAWRDTVPYSDYFYYHEAGRLQAEDVQFFFRAENVQRYAKLAWWPPGYPVFLGTLYAIVGPSARAAVAVQVLLGTLVCGLVYAIGARAVSRRVGFIAALLIAVDPTYIFATNLLASENLAVVWLAVGLWLAGRPAAAAHPTRNAVMEGIAFAFATLARAVCAGVSVVAAWWMWKKVPARRRAAWLLAAFFLVLAPWTIRNAVVAGSPALVCFGGGLNFYFGHNDAAPGYRDLAQTPFAGQRDPAAVDRMGWRLGWQHIGGDPLSVVTHGGANLTALVAPAADILHAQSAVRPPADAEPGAGARIRTDRARDAFLRGPGVLLSRLHTYLLWAGTIMAFVTWRSLPVELRLHALVVVYWIVVHVVFWAQPRFRYPMEISMALLCAQVMTRWRSAR